MRNAKKYLHANTVLAFLKTHVVSIFICAGIVCYLLSLLIVSLDPAFALRWFAFGLHILAVLCITAVFLKKPFHKHTLQKFLHPKEFAPFAFILIYIEFISFSLLSLYPWVSVGDEVRDGGWQAMQIANGTLTNIFAYGRYDAHGLIIPTITSFFYFLFGNTELTFRFPSALLACADVVILYIVIRLLYNKTAAFFGALILASFPWHIFYARTQIVDSFTNFWTSVLFLLLFVLLKKQRHIDYIFYGTLSGFVFGFHSSVRVVAILMLIALIFRELWRVIRTIRHKNLVLSLMLNIFFLMVFCFVGFGPRLLFSNTTNFFHTSRFVLEQNLETNVSPNSHNLQTIIGNYVQSLLVWVSAPTTSVFFQYFHPLLSPLLVILFAIGIGYSLIKLRQTFFYILLFLAISIPFFSSAITNNVNQDHRIITLLPIGSIFAGIGIAFVIKQLRFRYLQYGFMLAICLYLIIQTGSFFLLRPADKMYKVNDYLSMHVIYFLKSQKLNQLTPTSVCLDVSSGNSWLYNLPHYQEQYQYFLPSYSISVQSQQNIPDNEAYIFFGACPSNYLQTTHQQITICSLVSFDLSCPPNYQGKIILHY